MRILEDHSDYIEADPSSLFYCVYFCIVFNNPFILEFIRALVNKMTTLTIHQISKKIDTLLDLIDLNGIDRLRATGEKLNLLVFHYVMYQAFHDSLRVVYFKIIKLLQHL